MKRAHTQVLCVLSVPVADSITVQADLHYSSPLQYIGTVVL